MQRREQQRLNQASGRYGGSTNVAQMPYNPPSSNAYPSASTPYNTVADRESYRSVYVSPCNEIIQAEVKRHSGPTRLPQQPNRSSRVPVCNWAREAGKRTYWMFSAARQLSPTTTISRRPRGRRLTKLLRPYPTRRLKHLSITRKLHNTLSRRCGLTSVGCRVKLALTENVNAVFGRDGALQTFDVKGQLNIRINDPSWNRISVDLKSADISTSKYLPHLQFQQHPNIRKFAATESSRRIALRDPARTFPIGQNLAVLRWRLSVTDDKFAPCTREHHTFQDTDGDAEINA